MCLNNHCSLYIRKPLFHLKNEAGYLKLHQSNRQTYKIPCHQFQRFCRRTEILFRVQFLIGIQFQSKWTYHKMFGSHLHTARCHCSAHFQLSCFLIEAQVYFHCLQKNLKHDHKKVKMQFNQTLISNTDCKLKSIYNLLLNPL